MNSLSCKHTRDDSILSLYTVKTALVKIQIICFYKEVIIPFGIKMI